MKVFNKESLYSVIIIPCDKLYTNSRLRFTDDSLTARLENCRISKQISFFTHIMLAMHII